MLKKKKPKTQPSGTQVANGINSFLSKCAECEGCTQCITPMQLP